jgi:hypothetical protein
MATATALRSSRTPTPRGRDRRAVPAVPAGRSPRRPRTSFWACGPFQQLRRLPVHGQLLLELPDASSRRHEFSPLGGREPCFGAAVDALLPAPVVHRLVADAEVVGDVTDAAPACHQVKNTPPKLRWVSTSSHAALRVARQHDIQIIRLHESLGTLPGHTSVGQRGHWGVRKDQSCQEPSGNGRAKASGTPAASCGTVTRRQQNAPRATGRADSWQPRLYAQQYLGTPFATPPRIWRGG